MEKSANREVESRDPRTEDTVSDSGCATCSFRARHDKNPTSFLGRVWRWHANFCPGWKSYMRSLPDDEKRAIAEKYAFAPAKFA
jgi:hypothetical protein